MRIFVAGATGVIGIRLIALLVKYGNTVAGMTRSEGKQKDLKELGVEPILCNVYDLSRLKDQFAEFQPDLVIDELTDLPDRIGDIPTHSKENNRIRREGTRNLLSACNASNSPGLVVQSVAWELPGEGNAAVRDMENLVLEYGGTVLRYGQLYGPGTYYEDNLPDHPRIHVDLAAELTVKNMNSIKKIIELVEG